MRSTRDQSRGRYAYECVRRIADRGEGEDYKILVNAFGPNIIRSGLAAAVAFIDRGREKKQTASTAFLDDLAAADIPGLGKTSGRGLLDAVQRLEVDNYMLVTRETLQLIVWFKRAVQALL